MVSQTPWGGENIRKWTDRVKVVLIYGPIIAVFGMLPAALSYDPKQPGTSLMFLAGSWLLAYLVGEFRRARSRAALVRPIVMLLLAGLVGAGAMDSKFKPLAKPVTRQSGTLAGVSSMAGVSCVKWWFKGEERDRYQTCTDKPIPKGKPKGKGIKVVRG